MKKQNKSALVKRILNLRWTAAALLFVLALWQLLVSCTSASRTTPPPAPVIQYFLRAFFVPIGKYTMPVHILWSLERVMIGFLSASVLGIIVGVCMGRFRTFEAIIKPIFELLRSIPPLAWIPLAILWFGIGELPKYFIIFIGAFTSVTLNAYDGARSVDPELIGAGRMLGANEGLIFVKIVLPHCVPHIFAGLQVALSTSWSAVLAAEMIRSSEGLGWIIITGNNTGNTTQIMAGMIAIAIIGLLLISIMRGLERGLCAWKM